ncbi:MAG: hypothetical protein ACPGWR_32010 [Ardenticatenaceae bacterium]
MQQPKPITVRTRGVYKIYVWVLTLLFLAAAIALFLRMLSWMPLMATEPTLLALVLPVFFFFALAAWMARWALFHSTAEVTVNADGVSLRSAVVNDSIRWEEIEAIQLQGTSGSEAQLSGHGHRVTFPSGSAAPPEITLLVQDWITYRLNERDLDYRSQHFWGP